MLNNCEVVETALKACDLACEERGKICLFGDTVFQAESEAGFAMITRITGCQEESVQSLLELYIQAGFSIIKENTDCVCCSI